MTWKTTVNLSDCLVGLGRLLSTSGTLLYDLEDYCQLKALSCMTWKTTVNLRDSLVILVRLLST